jgi:hypothetical protein
VKSAITFCLFFSSIIGVLNVQRCKEIKDLEDLTDLPKYENGNNRVVQLLMNVDNEEKSFIFNGPLPNSYVTSIEKIE